MSEKISEHLLILLIFFIYENQNVYSTLQIKTINIVQT